MKLHLVLCALIIFWTNSYPLQAQLISDEPVVSDTTTTLISFQETNFDFGEIAEGMVIIHEYHFTNTGNAPLQISKVKPSCGCTVTEWPKEPIAPGERGSILISFDSKHREGRLSKRITVTANTIPEQTLLFLQGRVHAIESLDLPTIELVQEDEGEETTTAFTTSPPPLPTSDIATVPEEDSAKIDPSCFAVYPNPTAEQLRLDMSDHLGEDAHILIHNQNGKLMQALNITQTGPTLSLEVAHYPPGIYYIKLQVSGKQAETKCFVALNR